MGVLRPSPPEGNLYPRQQPTPAPDIILTQTITRSSTTFTTYVTLGGPPASAFQPAYQTPEPTPSPFPTQSTTAQPEPEHVLTSGEIGAILGSIFIFVIAALVAWACLGTRKRHQPIDDDSDDDGSFASHSTPIAGPPFAHHRRMSSDRVTTDFGSVYVERSPWTRYQQARVMRAAPEAHEVRMHPRPRPVFGNVRHVNVPPRSYFSRG